MSAQKKKEELIEESCVYYLSMIYSGQTTVLFPK